MKHTRPLHKHSLMPPRTPTPDPEPWDMSKILHYISMKGISWAMYSMKDTHLQSRQVDNVSTAWCRLVSLHTKSCSCDPCRLHHNKLFMWTSYCKVIEEIPHNPYTTATFTWKKTLYTIHGEKYANSTLYVAWSTIRCYHICKTPGKSEENPSHTNHIIDHYLWWMEELQRLNWVKSQWSQNLPDAETFHSGPRNRSRN